MSSLDHHFIILVVCSFFYLFYAEKWGKIYASRGFVMLKGWSPRILLSFDIQQIPKCCKKEELKVGIYTHAHLWLPPSFLAVNHHNAKNWVSSILTHHLTIRIERKQKFCFPDRKTFHRKIRRSEKCKELL